MNTVTEYLLRQRITELEAEVAELSRDASYDILTWRGLERAWSGGGSVIFGDIDGMHDLNAELGYTAVDSKIKAVLASVQTRADVAVAGRRYSGDEICWTLPTEDARAFADRIIAAFATHGLSITLGIAEAGLDLSASVACASDLVQAAKERGGRGAVYGGEG